MGNLNSGREFINNKLLMILPPGERFTETRVWDLTIYDPKTGAFAYPDAGEYEIKGAWLWDPLIETGSIGLTIREHG